MHLEKQSSSYDGISYAGSDEDNCDAHYAIQEHVRMDEDIKHT